MGAPVYNLKITKYWFSSKSAWTLKWARWVVCNVFGFRFVYWFDFGSVVLFFFCFCFVVFVVGILCVVVLVYVAYWFDSGC